MYKFTCVCVCVIGVGIVFAGKPRYTRTHITRRYNVRLYYNDYYPNGHSVLMNFKILHPLAASVVRFINVFFFKSAVTMTDIRIKKVRNWNRKLENCFDKMAIKAYRKDSRNRHRRDLSSETSCTKCAKSNGPTAFNKQIKMWNMNVKAKIELMQLFFVLYR